MSIPKKEGIKNERAAPMGGSKVPFGADRGGNQLRVAQAPFGV